MALKRGKLSKDEEQFIREGIEQGLKIHQIALQINRTDDTVQRYCDKHNLTYTGMSEETYDETILKAKLHERPYWREVQKQLTEDELTYFEQSWVRIMKQMREDIVYSEEVQLKQWIVLDIMDSKVMEERKKAQEQIERLENLLAREYEVPEENRDAETITTLETEISAIRNAQGSYTTEKTKILDKMERIQKDLKAARSDRVKKIEDSKSSWQGFIVALEDEELRQRVGEDIEINRMAKERAFEDLAKLHKYEDGLIDQPLLNTTTIREE